MIAPILLRLLSIVILFPTVSVASNVNEELLKRIEALQETIIKQQKEIEELKRIVREQGQKTEKAKEDQEKLAKESKDLVTKSEKSLKDWIPNWIKRTKVGGDLRLRYEGLHDLTNSLGMELPNRDQFRIRARLFFEGNINDELATHFMLCTNQDLNKEGTTTNQTFSDDFNAKDIYLHRAYGIYKPKWLDGLELVGGKFKNTFLHTDIMWDPDVNPEGFYQRYEYNKFGNFRPFLHLGQMQVNEVKDQTDDAWLFIEQLGFSAEKEPFKLTFAISFYDWANINNTKYLKSATYKSGGGNTFAMASAKPYTIYGYLHEYSLLEAIAFFEVKTPLFPLKFTLDYILNRDSSVPSGQDKAYYLGFTLGKLRKKSDWELGYKYGRIEKDSLLGSMADMDFYGANRKGHKVWFYTYPVDRLRVGLAYFITKPVTPWSKAESESIYKDIGDEKRIQVDSIFEF